MSEWRRRAIVQFPALRSAIDRANSPHGVFFELLPRLHDAYRAIPLDEGFIAAAFGYAEWCAAASAPDVRGAAMTSFYEHLSEFGPAWRDLPNRVSPAGLASIRDHLRGYLSPTAYARAIAQLEDALH